jgi:hypothetical protein
LPLQEESHLPSKETPDLTDPHAFNNKDKNHLELNTLRSLHIQHNRIDNRKCQKLLASGLTLTDARKYLDKLVVVVI